MAEHPLKTVAESDAGQRLDRYLKTHFPTVPYGAIQKWLRTGDVRVNGKKAKPDTRLNAGDQLRLPPAASHAKQKDTKTLAYTPTNADKAMLKAATLYEDDAILVLNKPAGLAAQAGDGHTRSLDRILLGIHGPEKTPKLVHRLDRDTTGVIILAKTRADAANLMEQFKGRDVAKTYLTLVTGQLPGVAVGEGDDITMPLRRSGARVTAADTDDGEADSAHTSWQLLANLDTGLHLLSAQPHTGRMNQIRAHLAAVGLPLVGDGKYGGPQARQASSMLQPSAGHPLYLHALQLTVNHPRTGRPQSFVATPPLWFLALTTAYPHVNMAKIISDITT